MQLALALLAFVATATAAPLKATPPLPPTPARNPSDPYYTAYHFQPLKNVRAPAFPRSSVLRGLLFFLPPALLPLLPHRVLLVPDPGPARAVDERAYATPAFPPCFARPLFFRFLNLCLSSAPHV